MYASATTSQQGKAQLEKLNVIVYSSQGGGEVCVSSWGGTCVRTCVNIDHCFFFQFLLSFHVAVQITIILLTEIFQSIKKTKTKTKNCPFYFFQI